MTAIEMDPVEGSNFILFREILSSPLIAKSSPSPTKTKRRKAQGKSIATKTPNLVPVSTIREERDDAAELGEFVDYIAHEIFTNFPEEIRTLTYSIWLNNCTLKTKYSTDTLSKQLTASILAPLPPHICDTLTTYSILSPQQTLPEFLTPILQSFINTLITLPPPPSTTKEQATECEICGREHVPLSYHHLIPRSTHAKVLKRGWHTEDQLNNVAWLCRACHSFVHGCASNEELAREWYTVEKLVERDDVVAFANWVGRVRWKKR